MVPRPYTQHAGGLDSRIWRLLAWVGVALQVVALTAVLMLERWAGALSLVIFLALSVLVLLLQDRLPDLIDLLVVVAALINAAMWSWDLGQVIIVYDDVTHAYSSFAIVSALGYLAWTHRWIDRSPHGFPFFLAITALGLGLGILWEIAEFTLLDIKPWDTTIDLMMDTLGACAAGPFLSWVIRRKGAQRVA